MADKKSNTNSKKYNYAKSEKNGKAKQTSQKKDNEQEFSAVFMYVVPIVLVLAGVVTAIALFGGDGAGFLGSLYGNLLRGLFSITAFLIPVFAIVFAFLFKRLVENETLGKKLVLTVAVFLLVDVLAHVIAGGSERFDLVAFYQLGLDLHGGGLVGSLIGWPLHKALNIILPILIIGALIILVPLIFSLTPADVVSAIRRRIEISRAERAAMRDEQAAQNGGELDLDDVEAGIVGFGHGVRGDGQLPMNIEYGDEPSRKKKRVIDVNADPAAALSPEEREEIERRRTLPGADKIDAYDDESENGGEADDDERVELAKVFTEGNDEDLLRSLREKYGADGESAGGENGEIELEVKRRRVTPIPSEHTDENAAQDESAYRLPPVTLLTEDPGRADPNVAKETEDNANRLTAALNEFNVRASILNTMHGPTVTRYELGLDTGVRVKSILSLADDISYSLAAAGSIRIEAPIPGKSAVGVEVPNKTRETVYLRSLFTDPAFRNDKPLWVALGADVAGESVYCDLSKMPHLLIAGTTGSGKSVCINTIIISILYRNTPDDVKMILIDPKHVEFAPYEGMPHLLVPVVSDMKKAAGALQWAVSEMERRYGLLEAAKVRDITGYNKARAASAEPMEPMPRIVIAIDELADLMMQARDSVEPSICRIAQKARAAGMHLVIGTQRPDVSVVTGLIKANIPSRIALTVKSQVDSRTMIDKAGAEKLLGNGDMLYNPIGIPEPKRVQGAYISDEEIAAVVEFIKSQGTDEGADNAEIIAEIEREAAKCASPKKGGGASGLSAPGEDGSEEDPMLMAALELAVENGKISTSLIQRRLSLGYGRSAKLIDRMQELGYVSAPDGQKPRDVLITSEQYLELKTKD